METKAWAFGSCQYVQSAVWNVEEHLAKAGDKLPFKAPTQLSSGYRPEIDVGNGYSVLLAVCSAICPASFGRVLLIWMVAEQFGK